MSSERFRFGLFEFDSNTLELRRDGSSVHLQAQPKQVLAHLVKNADRIVSRDELRRVIWGEGTFVDFERGLNFCIAQIRSTLGDDAAQPIFIRTLPRQGYHFIAPVVCVDRVHLNLASDASAPQRQQRSFLAVTLAIVFIMTLIVAYMLRMRPLARHSPTIAVVRFDNEIDDTAMSRFGDELTDDFVERLTSLSSGRYSVIGNAQILRVPRSDRDLKAISQSLNAEFIVLGQIQAYQGQTRILVHLIHMPEQIHVSVARMDRSLKNPLDIEAEVAQKVALDFSRQIVDQIRPHR